MSYESIRAIDTATELYAVFGDPIGHSKSPLMLNRAFAAAERNAAYVAFHVKPEGLGDAVRGVRALGIRGVNVTIPHKLEVMPFLDEIDEDARAIGAVNTIANRDGKLVGYNTDGIGYVRSLKEETGVALRGKRVLLLGAGGAARAIAYALAKEGVATIWFANRTREKARALAASIQAYTHTNVIGFDALDHVVGQVDLVVNNTPVGMYPNVDETPINPELLHGELLVSDLIYNPRVTKLLAEAQARGARIHSGLGMFIYQGAYAYEYWTGQPAPVTAMRDAVERVL
ncbi:shikimate dehydrogenase [Paenibacillus cymbidii]|uniref:shikimate dehydrogenase n=1 Tax=Paenibacillus cymbidii TaxID=1639034 RepID=UPI0010815752|nr:shikimate dehydrogenase [Paenibacillus cymbidii]